MTEAHQLRLDPDPLEPRLLSQGFRVGDLAIVQPLETAQKHAGIPIF